MYASVHQEQLQHRAVERLQQIEGVQLREEGFGRVAAPGHAADGVLLVIGDVRSEINLNDLDETSDGWEEISVEEAENIIANGKVMYTNKKD